MCIAIYAVVMRESRQFLDSFREIGNELTHTMHNFTLIAVNGDFAFGTFLYLSFHSFSICFFSAVVVLKIVCMQVKLKQQENFVITVAV